MNQPPGRGMAPAFRQNTAFADFSVTHKVVWRLAAPVMVASLSTLLVGAVATAVVGQLGEAALIGGIASATIVVNFLTFAFGFLRTSTTAMVAQALGAADADEMLVTALRAFLLAALAGAVAVIFQVPVARFGFDLLGIGGDVQAAARAYLHIRIWSVPCMLANLVVLGWLLGRGKVFLALGLQVALNLLNILLSILFVIHLKTGVEGAAVATVIAETCAFAVGLYLLAGALRGRLAHLSPRLRDGAKLRRMMLVNIDIFIRSLALFLTVGFITRQSAAYGTVVLAANVVLMNLFYLSGASMDGLATAAQQLAGRAIGANNRAIFDRVVRLTVAWSFVLALADAAVLLAAQSWIIAVTTTDPEVRIITATYFVWAVLTPLAGSLAFIMDGVYIGATWSREMRNMMLVSVAIFLAAWAAFAPPFGNHGLWLALILFLVSRGAALALRLPGLRRAAFVEA